MAIVDEQLAALEQMSPAVLREQWKKLTGDAVPRISPALLRLALAWEIQTRAFGGHPRATQQKLTQAAAGKTRTLPTQPGMRLVREWNGTAHVVTIGEDNVIRWAGREWRFWEQCPKQRVTQDSWFSTETGNPH